MNIVLHLNGEPTEVSLAGDELLQSVLADLGVTGSRLACGIGVCGACTVEVDGHTVAACVFPAALADGAQVSTIEGVADTDPVVRSFNEHRAFQCGFCTPGAVLAARELLREKPSPSLDTIREHMAGNLCRCGCYRKIQQAVLAAGRQSSATAETDH